MRITIEANKQVINFLDVTFNLSRNTFQPYTKPNTTLQYVHHESNHPPTTTKNIPAGINRCLSSLSSDKASFDQAAAPAYQKALNDSGYSYTLHYERTHTRKPKNRQHNNILWYNPPFSKNTSLLSSTKLLSHEKTPTQQKRTSGSLRTTSKQDTATTSHHSVTQRTETPLNSANTSGLLKTTTSTTLSPGAFYLHTCHTKAQANDATYVSKKNSLSADLNSLHLTNVMNLCLPAATETKPTCATTDVTNLALNKLCKSV